MRVGLGSSSPGAGAIGTAPGGGVPAYADVWAEGGAYDIVADFTPKSALRLSACLGVANLTGKRWTNPENPADAWWASDSQLTAAGVGLKIGKGLYAKAGFSAVIVPEVSRVDAENGNEIAIFQEGTVGAFSVGAGYDLKLGGLVAYADLEIVSASPLEEAENAVILWPNFEAGDGPSYLKLAVGVGFTF